MVRIRQSDSLPYSDPDSVAPWLHRLAENLGTSAPSLQSSLLPAVECARTAEATHRERYPETQSGDCARAGLEIAEILSELGMDVEGLQASILYRAVREQKLAIEEVSRRFGDGVAELIRSVLRMAIVTRLRSDQPALGRDDTAHNAKMREMLVSIIDDVRVALLKLAERTCAIRAVKNAPQERRRKVAEEIFDVYAPLAHRLGIGHLKWELEDLAFRYLEPEEYQQIARLLAEKRSERQRYINEMIPAIETELRKLGKSGEVSGRAKHIYSIWRKMLRKGVGFSQIYDIRAVRVLVPTVSDCYAVLGIVHSKWRSIPNEFDDYIASPKENGYRSLHTAVIGPGRKVIEVQIRTYDMHEEAEFGVCAHWQYKDGENDPSEYFESKIAWLRQVLEWHDSIGGRALGDFLHLEGRADRVYVFTPKGHVVDLPAGATPVDFAYHIHTDVGHRCRGARVNGRVVGLNHPLQTADQVEIITGKYTAPSRAWLDDSLAYLQTTRAKSKVQQWFKSQHRDQNITTGRDLVANELRRLGLGITTPADLANAFGCKSVDQLYENVGAGLLDLGQLVSAAQGKSGAFSTDDRRAEQAAWQFGNSDHFVYGAAGAPVRTGVCCKPTPGIAISGYRGKKGGITIHRKDCGNLLRVQARDSSRVIQLEWGGPPTEVLSVEVAVKAYDRGGLLRDITTVVAEHDVTISGLHTGSIVDGMVEIRLAIVVSGIEQLREIIGHIHQIPNVIDVCRVSVENDEVKTAEAFKGGLNDDS